MTTAVGLGNSSSYASVGLHAVDLEKILGDVSAKESEVLQLGDRLQGPERDAYRSYVNAVAKKAQAELAQMRSGFPVEKIRARAQEHIAFLDSIKQHHEPIKRDRTQSLFASMQEKIKSASSSLKEEDAARAGLSLYVGGAAAVVAGSVYDDRLQRAADKAAHQADLANRATGNASRKLDAAIEANKKAETSLRQAKTQHDLSKSSPAGQAPTSSTGQRMTQAVPTPRENLFHAKEAHLASREEARMAAKAAHQAATAATEANSAQVRAGVRAARVLGPRLLMRAGIAGAVAGAAFLVLERCSSAPSNDDSSVNGAGAPDATVKVDQAAPAQSERSQVEIGDGAVKMFPY